MYAFIYVFMYACMYVFVCLREYKWMVFFFYLGKEIFYINYNLSFHYFDLVTFPMSNSS